MIATYQRIQDVDAPVIWDACFTCCNYVNSLPCHLTPSLAKMFTHVFHLPKCLQMFFFVWFSNCMGAYPAARNGRCAKPQRSQAEMEEDWCFNFISCWCCTSKLWWRCYSSFQWTWRWTIECWPFQSSVGSKLRSEPWLWCWIMSWCCIFTLWTF